MKSISISDANDIYACCEDVRIRQYKVSHEDFKAFCVLLGEFDRMIKQEVDEDDYYWSFFLKRLRRYRFELCAAPLPFNYPSIYLPKNFEALESHLDKCDLLYPAGYGKTAHELLSLVYKLVDSADNPMMDLINTREAFGHDERILVIKEPHMVPAVEKLLAIHPMMRDISIKVPSQLRGPECYARMIVIGPTRWFPEYVYHAPRSSNISVLHYDWIMDRLEPDQVFLSEPDEEETAGESPGIGGRAIVVEGSLSPEELLPRVDWNQIVSSLPGASPVDVKQEDIKAKLFLLEGGMAVFLDAEEGASSIVIDLEEEDESQIKRTPVSDIRHGVFVLLRTEGGGDYIIPLADRILGEEAQRLRKMQKLWKSLLRDALMSTSLSEVVFDLRKNGSTLANETNIRNWMSYRSIRTHDYKDFAAIMRLTGLGDNTQNYWKGMGMIDSSHRKAGRIIRKMLLKLVLTSELNELERSGRITFELPGVDSASMTAFRVVDISPEFSTVPAYRIANPFELDVELWQG